MNDLNISGANNIEEILGDLGYVLTPDVNGWRSNCVYREGDNPTALKIYQDGGWTDFVESKSGRFEDLIALTLGHKTIDETREWLDSKDYQFSVPNTQINEPLIKSPKYKNKEFLSKLVKNHDYWLNRKIKLEVLEELGGGIYKNKYYFPIFDEKRENLVGWSARIIKGDSGKRWVIGGERKEFLYGDLEGIKKSWKVYVHEGISDFLTVKSLGVNCNLVQFGTEISFKIVNFLLRIPDIKIFLIQNNDDAGRNAIIKNSKKLRKYFDFSQVATLAPPTNFKDINEFYLDKGGEEVLKWLDKS